MKKILLLTVLFVAAASAAITFPNGAPTTVGVQVDVSIPGTGSANLYVISNEGNQYWVFPYQNVSLPYSGKIEITHPGTGLKLLARGVADDSSEAFDVVIGDANRWQILGPGETAVAGDARSTTGKTGTAQVTAGDADDYTVNICDKWWNVTTGSQTPVLSADDPFVGLPATPAVGTNSIELRIATDNNGGVKTKVTASGGLTQDVSNVSVLVNTVTQLLIVCPGELQLPGDDSTTASKAYPGKRGVPEDASMGSPYPVTVFAVDKCWNWVKNYTGTGEVTVQGNTQGDITVTPKPTISGGKADVSVLFTASSTNGENLSASEANGGKQTSYDTKVVVREGVTSIEYTLVPSMLQPNIKGTLSIFPMIGSAHVTADYPVAVERTTGTKEGFWIQDFYNESDSNNTKLDVKTVTGGEAKVYVWASAESTYVLKVTSGGYDTTLTFGVKEISGLSIAPNPWKYGAQGHDKINFTYKVEQAGAAEVMLLITDIYGNIVYKNTYTSGTALEPGQQTISWNAVNSKGNRVASGMYQAVLKITLTNLSSEVLKKNLMVIW